MDPVEPRRRAAYEGEPVEVEHAVGGIKRLERVIDAAPESAAPISCRMAIRITSVSSTCSLRFDLLPKENPLGSYHYAELLKTLCLEWYADVFLRERSQCGSGGQQVLQLRLLGSPPEAAALGKSVSAAGDLVQRCRTK